jgi:homocysteine S-methyltransferase
LINSLNQDEKSIANGDSFSEAAESIWKRVTEKGSSNLIAIGMNCVNPDLVSPLLKSVKIKMPFVVYPNSG